MNDLFPPLQMHTPQKQQQQQHPQPSQTQPQAPQAQNNNPKQSQTDALKPNSQSQASKQILTKSKAPQQNTIPQNQANQMQKQPQQQQNQNQQNQKQQNQNQQNQKQQNQKQQSQKPQSSQPNNKNQNPAAVSTKNKPKAGTPNNNNNNNNNNKSNNNHNHNNSTAPPVSADTKPTTTTIKTAQQLQSKPLALFSYAAAVRNKAAPIPRATEPEVRPQKPAPGKPSKKTKKKQTKPQESDILSKAKVSIKGKTKVTTLLLSGGAKAAPVKNRPKKRDMILPRKHVMDITTRRHVHLTANPNALDSSARVVLARGTEKQKKRKHRVSKLKKIILEERTRNWKQRMAEKEARALATQETAAAQSKKTDGKSTSEKEALSGVGVDKTTAATPAASWPKIPCSVEETATQGAPNPLQTSLAVATTTTASTKGVAANEPTPTETESVVVVSASVVTAAPIPEEPKDAPQVLGEAAVAAAGPSSALQPPETSVVRKPFFSKLRADAEEFVPLSIAVAVPPEVVEQQKSKQAASTLATAPTKKKKAAKTNAPGTNGTDKPVVAGAPPTTTCASPDQVPTLVVTKDMLKKKKKRRKRKTLPKKRNFKIREYCSQMLTDEIDKQVQFLLSELRRFHDRLRAQDPAKARRKRRFVCGLREVARGLRINAVKCIIISPNIEKVEADGGLDMIVRNIITMANEKDIPVIFSLDKKRLGRAMGKARPVSVVGVYDVDGAYEVFKALRKLATEAKAQWRDKFGVRGMEEWGTVKSDPQQTGKEGDSEPQSQQQAPVSEEELRKQKEREKERAKRERKLLKRKEKLEKKAKKRDQD